MGRAPRQPAYATRFTHLTTRGQNKLTVTQAQAVIAAAILRQLTPSSSATIEVMTGDETIIAAGRFGTGRDGCAAMTKYAKQWPNLVSAIEGCQGIGRHIANRVAGRGEQVVDVPPKLSARARVFATGQGRKTDATDAHCVALVAVVSAVVKALVQVSERQGPGTPDAQWFADEGWESVRVTAIRAALVLHAG